ncbi:FMN-binding negative transcriptional regulator [Halomonas sp. PR-M31]|uniref:FMN-binding negative transcriptional regulator n=1 Tax=Halomonas sp. PR-M31 TaxID=1471202 RepID=UPI0009E65DA3|nr:FMN-binding negative transcriptional regulator [Halomonas sp. PR-M31]
MLVPSHFREEDQEKLQQYIREYSFGVLVVADGDSVDANHVPFHFSASEEHPLGMLKCHVARVNPVWKKIEKGASVLAIFQGPNAYVSPSWYETKAETGRVVPTWNYLAVHVQGQVSIIQEHDWLKEHLNQLTDVHESGRENPWAVDDAPAEFTSRLVKAIVGIEIHIENLTGQVKASQNHPERNRTGVKAGLANGTASESAMSEFIG